MLRAYDLSKIKGYDFSEIGRFGKFFWGFQSRGVAILLHAVMQTHKIEAGNQSRTRLGISKQFKVVLNFKTRYGN